MDELTFEDFKAEYQCVPVEEYPNRVCEAMPDPVVSVHIGTYQHVDFIRDCIEGVLMQETDFPFEVVIGEDESDDGTREICKEYADRHPEKIRLLLHRRENNITIHGRPTPKFQQTYSRFVCRGKYIAICQGDDYWTDPLKLQKQADFLEANSEYMLSFHEDTVMSLKGELKGRTRLTDSRKRDHSSKDLMKGPFLITPSLFFRNEIDHYPIEFFDVLQSDKFLICLLGMYGKAKYQKEIMPSVHRKQKKGIWTQLNKEDQHKVSIKTSNKISDYYSRINRKDIVAYHKKMMFYERVRMGNYKEAVSQGCGTVLIYFMSGELGKAFYFAQHAIRTLIAKIRKLPTD